MATFALNYYFGAGFDSAGSFKIFNLAVHIVNGWLVFFLFRALLNLQNISNSISTTDAGRKSIDRVSLVLALLWLVHPIQINPVHYVVQRMTTLSALFVLLGLVSYLAARTQSSANTNTRTILFYLAVPIFLVLGLMSKENALLLLPFILLIELSYFRDRLPARYILAWPRRVHVGFLLLFAIAIALLVLHVLPGYASRDFTISQRLFTECRILVFYLGLIFVPLLYRFGLFHDDIQLSTGLLNPSTTVLSILVLLGITVLAVRYRRRYPYLLFGWLWFLIAHSIESTVIPLELAHEHRNYIALIGPLFACAGLLIKARTYMSRAIYILCILLVTGSLAFLSFLRSNDWSSYDTLVVAESSYHPYSPRAQAALGSLLAGNHVYIEGLAAMARAHDLKPEEPGYLLNMVLIRELMQKPVPEKWRDQLLVSYGEKHISPLALQVLDYAGNCALEKCRGIADFVETLTNACSNNKFLPSTSRAGCIYHGGVLAKHRRDYKKALGNFRASAKLDPYFLKPLIEIALVHLIDKNYTKARITIEELVKKNSHARFPVDRQLMQLIEVYNNTVPATGPGLIIP